MDKRYRTFSKYVRDTVKLIPEGDRLTLLKDFSEALTPGQKLEVASYLIDLVRGSDAYGLTSLSTLKPETKSGRNSLDMKIDEDPNPYQRVLAYATSFDSAAKIIDAEIHLGYTDLYRKKTSDKEPANSPKFNNIIASLDKQRFINKRNEEPGKKISITASGIKKLSEICIPDDFLERVDAYDRGFMERYEKIVPME